MDSENLTAAGMNAENFATYLEQPSRLYQVPYQEIKNLVEEYPYSAGLRWLLVVKSRMENDPKFEQHLHQLAARTFDRKRLFELVKAELAELADLATTVEERLELRHLHDLDWEDKELLPANTAPAAEAAPLAAVEIPRPEAPPAEARPPSPTEDDWAIALPDLPAATPVAEVHTPAPPTAAEPVAPAYRAPESVIADAIAGSLLTVAELAPRPTAAFTGWQQHAPTTAAHRWKRLRNYAHPTVPKAQEIARKSMEQPMVATETLGKLLAKQGQYAKAIKVYEQLSLVNPEKSSSFAATIQELKQKL